ncbi:2-amino-3-ketobutyrate coenzyme A ligase [Sinobacterium norvegicum]|uniref:2-amino-3-ketobutyrate coenzyme A ligase n=1 Tax=Sinobacterium norvegicum TaxID=1641715 RepID=A0ABM9ACG2_9GAMM|nr:glycine C-acetyltransferase [Sinobacterium norvegicum]CAH0990883.1 2-amino-3-ketobutyrate coenzyme A ligase [Sinobacterium norvegicum]
MAKQLLQQLSDQLVELKELGLYKSERVITTQQQAEIKTIEGKSVLNFCANNYLGLANSAELIAAGKAGLEKDGYGLASVRFICGTQEVHKQLENRISDFLQMDDTILYSSCFDANAGLFETILGAEDAIISDSLNHASIIDGVRLCKAKRFRYANNNMAELEQQLIAADEAGARHKLIATDGVFSMDGIIADLSAICDLADQYNALVMVDDSHAVGFVGTNGKGSPEHCGVLDRVDIITGTLGKALGGASGGYTSARGPIVEWLRQRSRPYLFSNTLAPVIANASLTVLDIIDNGNALRDKLNNNAEYFRSEMTKVGFTLAGCGHPIVPVMLGEATVASEFAERMLAEGIYVIAFSFPVVPQGQARIRTQMSAAHSLADIDKAVAAFIKVGRAMNIIQ